MAWMKVLASLLTCCGLASHKSLPLAQGRQLQGHAGHPVHNIPSYGRVTGAKSGLWTQKSCLIHFYNPHGNQHILAPKEALLEQPRHKKEGPMCEELLQLVHRHWLSLRCVPSLGVSLEEVPSFLGVSAYIPPEQDPGLEIRTVGNKDCRYSLP